MHPGSAALGHIVYQVHCVAACARKFPPFCFIRETSTGQTRSSARIAHTGYVESYPPSPSFDHSVYINADILSLFSSFLFSVSLRLKVWHSVDFFFSRLEKRDLTCLRIESLSWKLWNINAGYAIKRNKAFFSLYFLSVVLHCCVLEKYDLRLWALNFYSKIVKYTCNLKFGNKFF